MRRCFIASRAATSWKNANLLKLLGISTANPIGFIENRIVGLRHTAYYICEYTPAVELSSIYQQRVPTDNELKQFQHIFSCLRQAKVSHGDLKASNFLISDSGKITLIDLDSMKQHRYEFAFEKAFYKDQLRFLANWRDVKIKKILGSIIF